MIGRDELLGDLLAVLDKETLCALCGSPGVGKSTLARQAMRAFTESVWCDLTVATSSDAVFETLAETLGVAQYERDSLVTALAAALGQYASGSLVVLDNIEHALVDPHTLPMLEALRAATPGIVWLLTSRVKPSAGITVDVPPLSEDAAFELFCTRADLEVLDEGKRATVHSLVEALDRLPLAIELAASRAHLLQPAELEARLSAQRFELLSSKDSGLLHSLERSWFLLAAHERRAMWVLSLLRGPVDMHLAESLIADALLEERAPLDIIDGLFGHSLLVVSRELETTRLTMLSAVRDFAISKLAHDEREDLLARQSVVLIRHVTAVFDDWYGPAALERTRALRHTRALLEGVFEREVGNRPRLALSAARALFLHYWRSGPNLAGTRLRVAIEERMDPAGLETSHERARRDYLVALSLVRDAKLREHAATLASRALEALADPSDLADARLIIRCIHVMIYLGRVDEVRERLEEIESSTWAEALGGVMLACRGAAHLASGQPQAAADALRRSIHLQRTSGNPLVMLEGVHLLSTCLHFLGLYREVIAVVGETLESIEVEDDFLFAIVARSALANAHHNLRDLERADAFAASAARIARRAGHEFNRVGPTVLRARIALERSDLDRAEELLASARPMGASHDYWNENVCFLSGLTALLKGDMEYGASQIYEAVARAPGYPPGREVVALCFQAVVAMLIGDDAVRLQSIERLQSARAAIPRDADLVELAMALSSGEPPPTDIREGFFTKMMLRLVEAATSDTATTLVIGPTGRWFELRDGEGALRIDLSRRGPMRRILMTLGERHRDAAGPIEVFELFDTAWPGDSAHVAPNLAANRIYNNIALLRNLGLGDLLLGGEHGYELAPSVVVNFTDS